MRLDGGNDRMYAASSFARALDAAEQAATKAGDSYVTAERLLFGLAIAEGKASEILKKAGLTPQKLEGAIATLLHLTWISITFLLRDWAARSRARRAPR